MSVLIDTPIFYGLDASHLDMMYNLALRNLVAMPDTETGENVSLYLGASKDITLQASEDMKMRLGSSNVFRMHDDTDVASFLVSTTPSTTTLSSANKEMNLILGASNAFTMKDFTLMESFAVDTTVSTTTLSSGAKAMTMVLGSSNAFTMKDYSSVDSFAVSTSPTITTLSTATKGLNVVLGASDVFTMKDNSTVDSFVVTTTPTRTTLSAASKDLILTTSDLTEYPVYLGNMNISSWCNYQRLSTTDSNGFRLGSSLYAEGALTIEDSINCGANVFANSNMFAQNYNLFKLHDYTSHSNQAKMTGYAFTINSNDQLELVKYTSFGSNGDMDVIKRVAIFGVNHQLSNDTSDSAYVEFGNINLSLNGGDSTLITGNHSILQDGSVTDAKLADATITASKLDATSIGVWGVSGANAYRTTGNVGVGMSNPSYKLHVAGDIFATQSVASASDSRLKTNVKVITNALDKVNMLHGYTFMKAGVKEAGVIAQEVAKVLPEVVRMDANGYLGVAYGNMVGLLIEAIRDLSKQVTEIKAALPTAAV